MTSEQERKILKEAQERLNFIIEDEGDNRQMALDDLQFIAVDGAQWPAAIKQEREAAGQPCLTINKLPIYIDQVVGNQRQNRPSIKVIPVDSEGDPKVAKILTGWIKHVQHISKSDVAIDHGFEHAASCGYGAMRVVTRYASDSSFEQEAYIEKIDNALAVYFGKHVEYDCSDAEYCFIIEDMPREEFKSKYKVEPSPFNSTDSQYVEGWSTKDLVRVAEYFVKEKVKKKIYMLEDGRVVDTLLPDDVVVKERNVDTYDIIWYLLSGNKILDRKKWVGRKYIPVIPIWGKEFNVGGKRVIRGLIRNAKDSQRMYNYWQSCDTEVVALQPKSPYIATPKQLEGHEAQWREAHRKNYPYLLVNSDKDAPNFPQRQSPPQASSAMSAKIQQADQELRDTIGLQRASLGMPSNERSGAAIRERKMEGDTGTFAFIDNLARSMEHLGRILVDIAPNLLDTDRIIRLGLDDGDFSFEKVNAIDPQNPGKLINDLSVGTYDVVVVVGPSFTTQRTEARQSMQEFIQYYPAAAPFIGDLYAKSMDWPGAEEVSERLELLLPPEVREERKIKKAQQMGVELPPEPPPQPDPAMIMQMKEMEIKLQIQQVQLEQEKVKLIGMVQANELAIANSKEGIKKMVDEIVREQVEGVQAPPTVSPSIPPPVAEQPAYEPPPTPPAQQFMPEQQELPVQ